MESPFQGGPRYDCPLVPICFHKMDQRCSKAVGCTPVSLRLSVCSGVPCREPRSPGQLRIQLATLCSSLDPSRLVGGKHEQNLQALGIFADIVTRGPGCDGAIMVGPSRRWFHVYGACRHPSKELQSCWLFLGQNFPILPNLPKIVKRTLLDW